MVVDYWIDDTWVNLFIIHSSLAQLQVSPKSFGLENSSEDELIWRFSSTGKFFIAYADCCDDSPIPWWSKVWMKHLIRDINMFFWLLFLNKILTIDNLCKRGFFIPNRCYLCLKEAKFVDHIFLHCDYTMEVWNQVLQRWDLCWVFPGMVRELVGQWRATTINYLLKTLWSIVFPHVAWGLWKE